LPWSIAIYAPLSDFIGGIEENRARNIWIAIFIALVTGLVGLKIADRIHRPVRDFAARAGRASPGTLPKSDKPTNTYPELAEADLKIHELSRDLSHFARLNMMGQMAEGLAHELNQPLTSLTQNVDAALLTLEEQSEPNPELVEILNDMDRQAHHGAEIIRALRGLVRKDDDEKVDFDLTELLEQTLQLLMPEATEHGITISLDSGKIPKVIGNRVQIAQVIMNLTRNAIEAVDAANIKVKHIYIETKLIEQFVEVHVIDTGPGIDPNFDLFTQFESSKRDGMGLGLSLSRTLIEANNGNIWHEPKAEEKSRFCFTVPLAKN
jgi:signal transduction histidine kinase